MGDVEEVDVFPHQRYAASLQRINERLLLRPTYDDFVAFVSTDLFVTQMDVAIECVRDFEQDDSLETMKSFIVDTIARISAHYHKPPSQVERDMAHFLTAFPKADIEVARTLRATNALH